MALESKVQSKITGLLRDEMQKGNLYYEKRQAITFGYHKGIPDIWFCMNGKHYEVEVKDPSGERSTLQLKYESIFKKIGVTYLCVDSFEAFKIFFDKEKASH